MVWKLDSENSSCAAVVLYYTRDLTTGTAFWQCRLRLGTERKLVRRSTKTTDLAEAKATAEELYEESRLGHLARNRRGCLEK